MRYSIQTLTSGHSHLYRHGELVKWNDGHPTNAEFEFWCEIKQLQEQLGNLLAIIHRDGGHYTAKVGFEQSVKDAHIVWAKLQEAVERLKQTMREAGGDLLRGDVDGAYEALKKAVEE